jgi:ATP-dependent DNA ligase
MKSVMLCEASTLGDVRRLTDVIVERKYDGVRAYIYNCRLYDRRNADITKKFPEFTGLGDFPKGTMFDGEILVGESFANTAARVHLKDAFKVRLAMTTAPATFWCFDMVVDGCENIPLMRRKEDVHGAVAARGLSWFREVPALMSVDAAWVLVQEGAWEGIVVKDADAGYEGRRSAAWKKIKAWTECVAEFVKYELHAKGVRIETADGRAVNINGSASQEVILRMRRGEKVRCYVQYLPQAGSDIWRFQSFRGCVD